MKSGPFDVPCHEFGGPIGVAGLDVADQLTMVTNDLRSPRKGEAEPAADRSEHLSVFPPQFGSMSIVVPLVDRGMEFRVEIAVQDLVSEIVGLDLALDRFEFHDVRLRRHPDEPARQGWLDQNADLVDVANEIPINRPDARAAIAREDDKAFATQELQHLPNGR